MDLEVELARRLESLSRRELQVLAKTHGLKANGKNSEMVEALATLLVKGMRKIAIPCLALAWP